LSLKLGYPNQDRNQLIQTIPSVIKIHY